MRSNAQGRVNAEVAMREKGALSELAGDHRTAVRMPWTHEDLAHPGDTRAWLHCPAHEDTRCGK